MCNISKYLSAMIGIWVYTNSALTDLWVDRSLNWQTFELTDLRVDRPLSWQTFVYMRDTLHWLPIAQRISYRIAVLVWRCLLGSAPGYLCELCRPVSSLPRCRALRSSVTGQLLVPRAKTATRQRRAFSIVGPSTWNGLPLEICLLPKNNESVFCRLLKTDLYRRGWARGASE